MFVLYSMLNAQALEAKLEWRHKEHIKALRQELNSMHTQMQQLQSSSASTSNRYVDYANSSVYVGYENSSTYNA